MGREIVIAQAETSCKEYRAWSKIKDRCFNKNSAAYPYYGGRGIKVHHEWVSDYLKFVKDIGRAPSPKHSIDRIDNNGNYEPGNCRWATAKEQSNNRRSNVNIEIYGVTRNLSEWANELGLTISYIKHRMVDYGESIQIIAERFKYNPITRKCEIPFHERDTNPLFEHNGVKKNITEWAREFGCSVSYINNRRLRQGETINDIANRLEYDPDKPGLSNTSVYKRPVMFFEYKGQKRLLKEWAEMLGVTYNMLYGQVKQYGKSLSQVIQERNLKLTT